MIRKRVAFKFLSWILLGIVILSFSGCGGRSQRPAASKDVAEVKTDKAVDPDRYDPEDTWAFYWYICGSDLESLDGAATADIKEMLTVPLPMNVNVIIETGGASEWHTEIPADANCRWIYNSEGFTLLEQNEQENMGDPATLERFLSFCNLNYPADHRVVIFWNHGGGSVAGAAFDENYDMDSLTLPEMYAAFTAASQPQDSKYDSHYEMIGFDTCLMANLDVANTFADLAYWLVASEELEPGNGWDYRGVYYGLSNDPGMNGAALGEIICKSFYKQCDWIDEADMVTLSVIDLKQIPNLVKAYNDAGAEALFSAGTNTEYFIDFGRAARSAENYGGNNSFEGYTNMVDIGDLMRKADKLLPKSGAAVLDALEKAVVYQVNGTFRSEASGLSCYYSYNGDAIDLDGYMDVGTSPPFEYFYNYAISGNFADDALLYVSAYSGEGFQPQVLDLLSSEELEDYPVYVGEDGFVVMDLGKEIADKLTGVYFNLAYVDEESDTAVFMGVDNDLDANWDKGIFKDNFKGVWGSIDGVLVYMEVIEETDDYQIYAVPVLLNGNESTLSVSYTYETDSYQILGASKGRGGGTNGSRTPRKLLVPGDVIEPQHYVRHNIYYGADEDLEMVAIDKVVVTADTSFQEMDLQDGSYLFVFEMRDIRNVSYFSELVWFKIKNGDVYID